ncbi:adenosine deaminase [Lutimonas halocynthiae]|uniref:adenosine deaminase n=1 Tax=Lutimonas halocynthiae TaxID=1446477 RepID=UPI0025B47D0D|nr:adenosine deaminase [Lutimonas halocynthiae]MDN3644210.1 adenosine deaminase [Lutimonas halocynthiae]
MEAFIQGIPKAELHLHIEGTFEPQLMFDIAKRNRISIPFNSVKEIELAYNFDCLQDFLDIYYQGAGVLIHEQDFYDLTYSYLEKCAKQNIRHAEIMFDPQTHTDRGIEFKTVINGIHNACVDAMKNLQVSSLLIMSYLRHLPQEAAFKTLEQSLPFKKHIAAIGLDSSEKGNPPSKFKDVFQASVKAGYIPLAHAGEEGDADYVWEALDILEIKRIDHGNNSLQDDALVQEIIKRNIALTVCPLSNKALQVVPELRNHPLKKMMDLGMKVTVNSDDPAYFGGQLNQNFIEIQKALSLTKKDIYELAKNSFEYALLDKNTKLKYLNELDAFYAKNK